MSQPSEPPPEETQAPKGGRTKLIVIVVAIVVALVAIAAAAVYYFGLGRPCGTAASYSEAGPQTLSPVKPVTSMPRSVAPTAARGVSPTALPLITVGFTISLTGTYSVEGTNSLNGMKTAAEWINTHGGITVQGQAYNVSLKYYDDQSNSNNIAQLYSTLIQQDGAQFLLDERRVQLRNVVRVALVIVVLQADIVRLALDRDPAMGVDPLCRGLHSIQRVRPFDAVSPGQRDCKSHGNQRERRRRNTASRGWSHGTRH